MALDCEKGVGDPCFVSRIECQACDELCRRTYKQHIMDKIEPAAIVAYFVLAFCVIAGATMTYLISTPRVGLAAKFGLIINACVALCSFIGIFFFVYTINTAGEGCPPGQSCAGGTLYVCLFLCVVIMVVSAGAAYSINKSNRGFMRIANALYIALSFIMMMAAILLSVASGAISDIDTYYNDNWVHIRAELDSMKPPYCGNTLEQLNVTYNLASDDPCQKMVKEETADNATLVGVIGTVVLVFIMLALYFNQKAMKYIGHLLDDVSDLGSRIGAAKEQVEVSKKQIGKESEELERQLAALKAS